MHGAEHYSPQGDGEPPVSQDADEKSLNQSSKEQLFRNRRNHDGAAPKRDNNGDRLGALVQSLDRRV